MSEISFSDYDLYLLHEGTHYQSYKLLGAHPIKQKGVKGFKLTVWAPHAKRINVVGDFNKWQGCNHPMHRVDKSGLWGAYIPELGAGDLYKYEIHTQDGQVLLKADPYAFYSECRPKTASVVYNPSNFQWQDAAWQEKKQHSVIYESPVLIYEVHLGSWKKDPQGKFLNYRELAEVLPSYAVEMGYTHIELLPVAEHPFDGSWGYQITGLYSITSRFGTPEDFAYFVDSCHRKNIGVILDWVPSHFCKDEHGLRQLDGQPLYEYADAARAEKNEWGTLGFDFSKPEVISFLISNALFWLDVYHIDGLRVDAVTSMLYLNYGKQEGSWKCNPNGGNENLEAVNFLKKLSTAVFKYYPNTLMIAEESTTWPMVSAPVYAGGLGFNYKWNMGWMNDILRYMQTDPLYRKYRHKLLTFSFYYAFSENYILALSHDEVVHGKNSLLSKMPGDYWQKFANLRLLFGYMLTHPGKKLLFMGGEFAQFAEWDFDKELDWGLLDFEMHTRMQTYVKAVNKFYTASPALWEQDHSWDGFEWIDADNATQSVVVFIRKAKDRRDYLIVVGNFTPQVYHNYPICVPEKTAYIEVFNSDLNLYGGSQQENTQLLKAQKSKVTNSSYSIELTVPPLALVILKPSRDVVTGEDNA